MAAHDPAGAPSRARQWLGKAQRASAQAWATLKDYVVRVGEKADDDNLFVLASGLTFSFVAAAIPFLFIVVALISLTLEAAAEAAGVEPIDQLRRYLNAIVPVLGEGVGADTERNLPEEVIEGVVNRRREIGLIGFVAFVWLSTRLFGSVRAVLREIFDLRQSRGVIQGKIFDAQMVLVSGVLVILNMGITIVFNLVKARGIEFLGLSAGQVGFVERASAWFTALAFIFILFLLLYKYVPARRIPWRMALAAAAFTAVCWEILKLGFAIYLTRVASYQSIYGGIATLVVVAVWFYYMSIVFVLGAEVAQVYEMRRVRRQQIEVLE